MTREEARNLITSQFMGKHSIHGVGLGADEKIVIFHDSSRIPSEIKHEISLSINNEYELEYLPSYTASIFV